MHRLLLFCMSFVLSLGLLAQEGEKNFSEWIEGNGISLRKSFDGSKDEQKPATFGLLNDLQSSNDYFNVDVALKITEIGLIQKGKSNLIFFPKIEYHRSSNITKEIDKFELGINAEYVPFQRKAEPGVIPHNLPNLGVIFSPWVNIQYSTKRNFLTSEYEEAAALILSISSNYKYLPGRSVRDENGEFIFRYYPYIGFEYNSVPQFTDKMYGADYTSILLRMFFEYWVVPRDVQLTFDWQYRRNYSDAEELRKHVQFIALSTNFYPGKQENVGLLVEYKRGYLADTGFEFINRYSVNVAVKF
ncbi:hypothetical protein [Lewinella cohaerens]|uniref:hypothetical protein n=1 Tax=Lewinella cohaerens TaxID=70995 RepID=UPI0003612D83|nr:hypothetical protein [Lewinella cohaerens]